MDPYLEDEEFWHEFHSNLASAIQAQLVPQVRPKYRVDLEPTIVYEMVEPGQKYFIRLDVTLVREAHYPTSTSTGPVTIAPLPLIQEVEFELEVKLLSLAIYTTKGKQLVTTIEILSPANKIIGSQAYQQYLRKRNRILNSPAHWLEIDLFRAGPRIILGHNSPNAPYFATLSRASDRPKVEIWPMELGLPLSILPVPLLDPDPDVPLDLNAAIVAIYDNAGYDYVIDYSQAPPPPPLSADQMARLEQLKTRGNSL
jgi:hypothetical protein